MRKWEDLPDDLEIRNWYLAAIAEIERLNNPVIDCALSHGWFPETEYLKINQYEEIAIECAAAEWLDLYGIDYEEE